MIADSPSPAGGLSGTPRDIARLGMIVAEGGAGIVPEDFIDEAVRIFLDGCSTTETPQIKARSRSRK